MGLISNLLLKSEPPVDGLVASADYSIAPTRRLDITSPSTKAWQKCAWEVYDEVSEVSMAARLTANATSMAVICPAKVDAWDVTLLNFSEQELASGQRACVRGPDQQTEFEDISLDDLRAHQIGSDILQNLFGKASQSYTVRLLVENLFVAGEAWLVQSIDRATNTLLNDSFEVFTCESIQDQGTHDNPRLGYVNEEGQFKEFLPDQTVLRFLYAHPRNPTQPHSSVRTVLEEAKLIAFLRQLIQSTAHSGVHNGLLTIPNELSLDKDRDKFHNDIIKALSEPIGDPMSAANIAPSAIFGDSEYLDDVRHVQLTRSFDTTLPELIERVERRIFRGLDLPIEIINGIGSTNHWSSWAINSTYVRNHIQPVLNIILETLNRRVYAPKLEAAGLDPAKYCFSADLAAIAAEPNEAKNAQDAYSAGALKAERYLQALGFNPATDLADPIRTPVGGTPIGEGVGGAVSTDRSGGTNPSRPNENGSNQPVNGNRDDS